MDFRRKRSLDVFYCYAIIVYSGLRLAKECLMRKDK